VKQNQRQAPERDIGKYDSEKKETPRRPTADRAYAGDRPRAAQEGGLLRELKESPRHLD